MADQIKEPVQYWHEHEVKKAIDKVRDTLFALQNLVEDKPVSFHLSVDALEVYQLRCKLGDFENRKKIQLGYKDGSYIGINCQP